MTSAVRADASQSDLLLSYQDKFYGWPGAYTGFATLNEVDDTQTTLLLVNHRAVIDNGWWEAGAAYRRLVDDYDFDRTTAESETEYIQLYARGARLQPHRHCSWNNSLDGRCRVVYGEELNV